MIEMNTGNPVKFSEIIRPPWDSGKWVSFTTLSLTSRYKKLLVRK